MTRLFASLVGVALLSACEWTIAAGRDRQLAPRVILDDTPALDAGVVRSETTCTSMVAVVDDPTGCTLTVQNHGAADLALTGFALNDGGGVFALATARSFPVEVGPGGALEIEVAATPKAAGVAASSLVVLTSDAERPYLLFPLSVTGVSEEALLVQLLWSSAAGDFDLHVIQADAAGRFCAAGGSQVKRAVANAGGRATLCDDEDVVRDCAAATCVQAGAPLDWDATGTASAGDPRLLMVDHEGGGPEAILVQDVPPGRYLVAAHRFRDPVGPVEVAARIFVDGAVAAERATADIAWWEVGIVDVKPSGNTCFYESDADGCL